MKGIKMVRAIVGNMDFDLKYSNDAELVAIVSDSCKTYRCGTTLCRECPYDSVENFKLFNATLKELVNESNGG